MSEASVQIREHIEAGTLSEVFSDVKTYRRAGYVTPLMRVVMAVQPNEHIGDEGRTIAWGAVEVDDLNEPITRGELEAWFQSDPHQKCVQTMSYLLDPMRKQRPTYAEALEVCAQVAPHHIQHLLPSSMRLAHLPTQHMLKGLGASLGRALGIASQQKGSLVGRDFIAYASPEGVLEYLERCREILRPSDLHELMRALPEDLDLSMRAREVYTEIFIELRDHEQLEERRSTYRIATHWLDAEQIARIIRANDASMERVRWLMASSTTHGHIQVFEAFGLLLGHHEIGKEAALYLALLGEQGRHIARRILDDEDADEGGRVRAEIILEHEPPKHPHSERALSPLAGQFIKAPRFGYDPEEAILSPQAEVPEAGAPTPREELEAVYAERTNFTAETLSPDGWIDLLWVLTFSANYHDKTHAYDRALEQGVLGRGATRDQLIRVIDWLDWGGTAGPQREGYGHLLLWAGADREVFEHALARFQQAQCRNVVGAIAKHFSDPLEESDVAWAKPMSRIIFQHRFMRQNPFHALDAPRSFASAQGEGSVSLTTPGDVWLTGSVEGADTAEVALRDGIVWHLNITDHTFRVTGLPDTVEGTLPPATAKEWSFTAEIHKNRAILGVNGVIVEHAKIEDLPVIDAQDSVSMEVALPEGDRCELVAHEKFSETLSKHTLQGLNDLQDVQEYAEIAAMCTPVAAYTLYVLSQLSPFEASREAAMRQLCELGELAEPFLGEVPEPQGPAPLDVVSFNVLIERMKQAREGADVHHGTDLEQTPYGTERWASYDALEQGEPETGPDETPVLDVLCLVKTDRAGDDEYVPFYISDNPQDMIVDFVSFEAHVGWYQGSASGDVYTDEERRLALMDLSLEGPDYGGWPSFGRCILAFWPCDEGWVYACWGGSRQKLQHVMGLQMWPTQLEWRSIEGYLGH